MKTLILLKSRDLDRVAFQAWVRDRFAPSRLATWPGARRVTLLLVDQPSPFGEDQAPTCDAIIEVWSDAPVGASFLADPDLAQRAVLSSLVVNERIEKDVTGPRPGERTPGLALVALWTARPALPAAEIRRHWTEHVPLALEVHHGALRYVQDWIEQRDGAPVPYAGMAYLHFRASETLPSDLFRSPEDVARINADVDEFISETETMFVSEHIVKA